MRFFKHLIFILLMAITVYSRFLNLDWDRGWGFHPDENNLWGASRRVELFRKLDPGFYAYGGVPIYLYSLLSNKVTARAVSAGLQTLTVGLLFVLGKRFGGWRAGLFSGMMAAFSAGLVQAGHFLTVESLLGLFSLLLIFILPFTGRDSVSNLGIRDTLRIILLAVILGLGVGTKVSFAVFAIPLLLIVLRSNPWLPKVRPLYLGKVRSFQTIKSLAALVLSLLVAAQIFFLTNPFVFSKWNDVRSTLEYEAKVATGSLAVFYTREFLGTGPGWFQAIHVFPYVTGWLFLPMFFWGIAVLFIQESPGFARRLLMTSVIAAFLSFLPFWAKWTRYAVQVLPILILVAGVGAGWVWEKGNVGKALVIVAMISFLPQFFSTLNVYAKDDTRIAAAKWAEINIPVNSKIFTEAMDLGILPFNPTFGHNIKLFNFYELDEVKADEKQKNLDNLINESDYFILLSRRVYKNSLDRPDKFPRAAEFYKRLFDGSLGYKKIYEYSSAVIPAKPGIYLDRFLVKPGMTIGISPEETFEVFDNPKVVIFEKK